VAVAIACRGEHGHCDRSSIRLRKVHIAGLEDDQASANAQSSVRMTLSNPQGSRVCVVGFVVLESCGCQCVISAWVTLAPRVRSRRSRMRDTLPSTSNTQVDSVKALNLAGRFAVVEKKGGREDVSHESRVIVGLRHATLVQRPSYIKGKHENRQAYDHGQTLICRFLV
jgi:hypothetical protein